MNHSELINRLSEMFFSLYFFQKIMNYAIFNNEFMSNNL